MEGDVRRLGHKGGGTAVDWKLYSPARACELLSISRSKLYEEMAASRLAFVHNGRRRFIRADELERYVASLK